MTPSPFIESRDSMTDLNAVLCLPSSTNSISNLNGVGEPDLPPPPPSFLSPLPAGDLAVLSLSLTAPRVAIENHRRAGSGSGLGAAAEDRGETWTTLNPTLDVAGQVQSIINTRMQLAKFFSWSRSNAKESGSREQVEGSAVKGQVGELIQLPGIDQGNITTTATVNLPPPAKERIRDFCKLNRSDFAELDRHGFLLGERQQRHLKAVEKKQKLFPKRFRQAEYLPQSAIMLLSNGWASAERYACCGIRNKGNPSGACKLHKYCPDRKSTRLNSSH